MTDYKKYSLENLENWLYDAMSCGDATPQEIYDTIIKVVKDEYYTYKKRASESYELLALLNGNGKDHLSCDKDDPSPECQGAWNDFWESSHQEYVKTQKVDQVNRWVLPVEVDGLTGECYVQLPDDLLERIGLKEGDMVHFIDRGDGSFEMRKVNGPE
jgi:antitoxin component of MazEF toxin-antitoxin module